MPEEKTNNFSKPQLVFNASQKCVELRGKEMRSGYFNESVSREGTRTKIWVDDTRKVFCSSVSALNSLLVSEVSEDESYVKSKEKTKSKDWSNPIDKIKKRMSECFEDYAYKEYKPGMCKGNRIFVYSGKSHMPEIDAIVKIRKLFNDDSEELMEVEGHWNDKVNFYWNELIILYDLLFEELMRIIHRRGYFKGQTMWKK